MPIIRMRLSVQRLLLGVVLLAFPLAWLSDRSQQRRERCLDLAGRCARLGAEYRRNSRGDAGMLRIAAWHESLSRELERAANQPWGPIPSTPPFPPASWQPTPKI